ncbi:MAG: argininosuccinate lyase, partial [Ilumatobacteraceae bacterium]
MTDTPAPTGKALWHGRFEGGPSAELMAYTESLSFDRRLWPDEIAGSIAHVLGLARSQIIAEADSESIVAALNHAADELASGSFVFAQSDEDIHTAIERRVTELAGAAGAKLHTGRSRNDQSATSVRRWMKRELMQIVERLIALQT